MDFDMGVLWLAAAVIFGVLEAVTVQFVSIWFAFGTVCALCAYIFGADAAAQWVTFVISSGILLICTRPLVKKLTKKGVEKTNADSLIGKKAVITKPSDSMGEGGEAKIDGKYWTVCSADGQPICENATVTVEKIEGVKLIVKNQA